MLIQVLVVDIHHEHIPDTYSPRFGEDPEVVGHYAFGEFAQGL